MLLPRERMAKVFSGEKPDRVPFVPTIYEHAAFLINKTPSEVARNERLLINGHLKAFDLYKHDLVVVGMDVYNVEAEALGCKVKYYDSENMPGIVSHVLADKQADFSKLEVPEPEEDGRMPLFLGAASKVKEKIGSQVGVASSIIGPFTLACLLRGSEKFIFDMLERRGFAEELLRFTTEVGLTYGKAFSKRNLGVAINDSWISPPILSPELYRKFVFPKHRKLIKGLKESGLKNVSLISGGDTTPLVDKLTETGSSLLLADANADLKYFKKITLEKEIVLRGTVNSQIIESGTESIIRETTQQVLEIGSPGGCFVIGCGVVSYNTPPQNVLIFKEAVEDFSNY